MMHPLLYAGLCLLPLLPAQKATAATPQIPKPADWITHVTQDIMPFWTRAEALGEPVGRFPTDRCDDGTLPGGTTCDGVPAEALERPRLSVVVISRLTYAYAVAFHMTGDTTYLDYARKGLKFQIEQAFDPESGTFFAKKDLINGERGPPADQRPAVRQAYSLLGPSFMYYLTRDPSLLKRIDRVRTELFAAHRDPASGGLRATAADTTPSDRLSYHLDQLNAYLYQVSASAPERFRVRWLEDRRQIAYYMRANFFDASTGLFRPVASIPEGSISAIQ
jgi:mannose/cellobiose epimerase-like protein (N-acyl-D-glucosamine 2-epimerase family)